MVHLRIFIFFIVLSTIPAIGSLSFAQAPQFSEENELIMAVQLADGTPISDGLMVYRLGNQWFLPLQALMETLNVSINVSPSLGSAEGDFISPEWHFKMEKSLCRVEVKSKIIPTNCEQIIVDDDEIFVDTESLEKWFPITFKINSYASLLVIISPEKFPQQSKLEREKLAGNVVSKAKSAALPFGYESKSVPEKTWAGPIFEQQLTAQEDSQFGKNFRHDSAVAFELSGFETKGVLGGTQEKVDTGTLNFSKKNSEGNVITNTSIKEVQAFDLNLPSLPLISGFSKARGLMISSFPLTQPTNFSSRDFRGSLPSGWEIELYQNDLLIGREVAEAGREYEFKDVLLLYGVNRFRLVFYGPQGQKREEVETVNIGQNFTKPGEGHYRIALAEKFEVGEDFRTILQYQYGLTRNWSLGSAYLRSDTSDKLTTDQYGLLSVNGTMSRFLVSLNAASSENSGSAFEESVQIPFERGSIRLSQAQLFKFRSDLFGFTEDLELKSLTKLSGSWGFPNFLSLRLGADINQKEYQNSKQTTVTQRTSWQTGNTFWFNTFEYDKQVEPALSGQLAVLSNALGFEIRPQIEYANDVNAVEVSLLKKISDKFNYEVGYRDSFLEKLREARFTLTQVRKAFTWSAQASTNSAGEYRILGLISYSLVSDPNGRAPVFSPYAQVDFGAAKAKVFLDRDYNSIFSAGDTPIENAHILINQNETNSLTSKDGEVILARLPVHENVDLSVSLRSLPDPLYKLVKKGIRISPRTGHVYEIDFPVIIQTEIEGLVQINSKRGIRPRGQIQMELLNKAGTVLSTVRTAADGYFILENINPGSYQLRPKPEQLASLRLKSNPDVVAIEIPENGILEGSYDFTLTKSGK